MGSRGGARDVLRGAGKAGALLSCGIIPGCPGKTGLVPPGTAGNPWPALGKEKEFGTGDRMGSKSLWQIPPGSFIWGLLSLNLGNNKRNYWEKKSHP